MEEIVANVMRQIKKHIEWLVLATGLVLLAMMNPEHAGTSWCLFDLFGFDFCPGEGLGHSISYSFRGDFRSAFNAHFAGPFAILILSGRVLKIWYQLYIQSTQTPELEHYG